MKQILIALILFVTCSYSQSWVSSVTPGQNQHAVLANTAITVTLDRDLHPLMPVESTVVVIGNDFGRYYPSSVTYNASNRTITFIPSLAFNAGEHVQVSVTPKVRDINGNQMPKGFVWQFLVGTKKGNGEFTPYFSLAYGLGFTGMPALLDFNGDRRLDFATGMDGPSKGINLSKGNGNGTFEKFDPIPLKYPGEPWEGAKCIVPGDFNNDGSIDICSPPDSLILLTNDGTGHFTRHDLGVRHNTATLASGDFNGDGNLDLISFHHILDSSGMVYLGDGKGNFPERITLPHFRNPPYGSVVGDFNNDGALDVIAVCTKVVHDTTGMFVTLLLNDGYGHFTIHSEKMFNNWYIGGFGSAGDLNNDGNLDYVLGMFTVDAFDTLGVKVLLNDGTGNFTEVRTILPKISTEGGTDINDIDGDGNLDIIAGDNSGSPGWLMIAHNDGKANFTRQFVLVNEQAYSPWLGDIDGDGDVDIVISTISPYGLFVEVLINDTPVGVGRNPLASVIPTTIGLKQNYPNPFNSTTEIQYDLPEEDHVTLKVIDPIGKEVMTLVDEEEGAGRKSVRFNAEALSSGLYFYRMIAGRYSETKKMLLVR